MLPLFIVILKLLGCWIHLSKDLKLSSSVCIALGNLSVCNLKIMLENSYGFISSLCLCNCFYVPFLYFDSVRRLRWKSWHICLQVGDLLNPVSPDGQSKGRIACWIKPVSFAAVWRHKVSRNFSFHRKGNKGNWYSTLKTVMEWVMEVRCCSGERENSCWKEQIYCTWGAKHSWRRLVVSRAKVSKKQAVLVCEASCL